MSHPAHDAPAPHPSPAPSAGSRGLAAAAVAVLTVGLAAGVMVGPAYAGHRGGWSGHQAGTGAHAQTQHPHHGSPTHKPKPKPKPKPGHGVHHDHQTTDGGVWHTVPITAQSTQSTQSTGGTSGTQTDHETGSAGASETLATSLRPGVAAASAGQPTPAPVTPYEMPFPCGQTWTGTSRPDHTPSPRAVDWNAPDDLGSPVVAAAAGTVTTAVVGRHLGSYGQYVVVDHGNGESTLYGHLDSVLVTVGQVVTQGQQIGTLGSTGNSTGPHLHFEERLNGIDQDEWFHGAVFPMNTAAVSQNCPGVLPPVTTITTPISTRQLPLAGNMYGSRPAEVMVYKLRDPAAFVVTRAGGKPEKKVTIGSAVDQPVIGDWDGNGRLNPGVRNPESGNFWLSVHGRLQKIRFGQPSDLPVAGNWDGTGAWEVGVRKAHSGTFKLRADDGSVTKVALGDAADLPVTGDWNGDGITDLGVYDLTSSVFTLQWTDGSGATYQSQVAFGVPGDYPVAGDWNGDGVTDVGVWDPRTRRFAENGVDSTVSARAVAGRAHARRAHARRAHARRAHARRALALRGSLVD